MPGRNKLSLTGILLQYRNQPCIKRFHVKEKQSHLFDKATSTNIIDCNSISLFFSAIGYLYFYLQEIVSTQWKCHGLVLLFSCEIEFNFNSTIILPERERHGCEYVIKWILEMFSRRIMCFALYCIIRFCYMWGNGELPSQFNNI